LPPHRLCKQGLGAHHAGMNNTPCPGVAMASGIDHIGIRVSDRDEAMAFYARLGFVQTHDFPEHQANEMQTPAGVRINLIFNGARRPARKNVLLDEPIKLPGITHPAFLVDDLPALAQWLRDQDILITEGPERIGPRRVALFIRDPDGNVLEFDQLLAEGDGA
jgi:lactoylglutathione lyase